MIIDELDDIKCEECYRCAIEDMAEFVTDPESLLGSILKPPWKCVGISGNY